jgi:hypothetical protein
MNSGITDELSQLKGIWGVAANNVFAVGTSGIMLQYDGTFWHSIPSGTDDFLNSVWGSAPDNVFAVGENGTILRFDGDPAVTTTSTSPPNPCPVEEIYGEHATQTELLRAFRDTVASRTPEGRQMIVLYYAWSPIIVKAMQQNEASGQWLKEMIDGIIPLIAQAVAELQ